MQRIPIIEIARRAALLARLLWGPKTIKLPKRHHEKFNKEKECARRQCQAAKHPNFWISLWPGP